MLEVRNPTVMVEVSRAVTQVSTFPGTSSNIFKGAAQEDNPS